MIYEFPELLSKEIIERANKLSTPLLCDGMKDLDILNGGCMEASIMPVESSMRMVGTACTVETSMGDNLPIHLATYAAPCEGYIMVIDGKGYADRTYFGDLIMGAAKAVGFKGMVIDGYTRDFMGNLKLQFPVFCKGLTPRSPLKKDPGIINGVIICGGIQVKPGDLIMGDCDGVCVVPKKYILQVIENAEEKVAYEKKRVDTINAYNRAKLDGTELPQLAPQWALDKLKAI